MSGSVTWLALTRAAHVIDMSAHALRRRCERHAHVGEDGVIEAVFDGIRARKIGRLWRIAFSREWLDASCEVDSERSRGARRAGKGKP